MPEDLTFQSTETHFVSFDGSTKESCNLFQPDQHSFWENIPKDPPPLIPRGAGLSYTAASFASKSCVIDHRKLNRILRYDDATHTLEVESGTSLETIYNFLTPRGRFLAVQPGYPTITVGGCMGADVHGKNQFQDGTFLNQVESLQLFHPSHGTLELSEQQNPDLFRLTCGGYGLTGNIITATLRTKPIPSPLVQMSITFILDAASLPATLEKSAQKADLVFSWHDFTKKGNQFGRGFLVEGAFANKADCEAIAEEALKDRIIKSPITSTNRDCWQIPAFNSLSTPPFNRLYYWANRLGKKSRHISLYDFIFPVHNKQVYFELFGKSGFHEYQTVVPSEQYGHYIEEIKKYLQKKPQPITLASSKLFTGKSELLRFTGTGICLALNFPRTTKSMEFANFLDGLICKVGAIPNIIKDSRLTVETVKRVYPEYERFRSQLREFDPERLYQSELSKRLGL